MSRPAKQKRSAQTRREVLNAARFLFAQRGFAEVSMDDIAGRVGISRGPLYHYFRDKQDLFREVYEKTEAELADRVIMGVRARSADAGPDAWREVATGCQAFLDACLDSGVQRILLLEAPSVLGWEARRDIANLGLGMIRSGLQRAIEQGLIEPQPIEPLAHLLRAVLTEGAMLIARAGDHASARAEVGAAVDRLINGLRRERG